MSVYKSVDLIEEVILGLKKGQSLRSVLKIIVKNREGPLVMHLATWMRLKEKNQGTLKLVDELELPENISFFLLLENGFKGQSIMTHLESLKKEAVELQTSREEQYLQTLPYKMLIPLFVFFFPALMWSFLQPFLMEFQNAFTP